MTKNENTKLCLGVALLQNSAAFKHFIDLPISRQQDFIENAHDIKSDFQMRKYVDSIRKCGENSERRISY